MIIAIHLEEQLSPVERYYENILCCSKFSTDCSHSRIKYCSSNICSVPISWRMVGIGFYPYHLLGKRFRYFLATFSSTGILEAPVLHVA
jgi:hypothetical protein